MTRARGSRSRNTARPVRNHLAARGRRHGRGDRARDTRLDRIGAVKILAASLHGRDDGRERFEREARAIASIVNGCVVRRDGAAVICSLVENRADAWIVEDFDSAPKPRYRRI